MTGLLWNNETVGQELSADVAKAVEDTIRNRSADGAICRTTYGTPESGSLVRDLSQRIVEDDPVIKLLATHDNRHVDQALDDWGALTNLTKTATELSDCVKNVAK